MNCKIYCFVLALLIQTINAFSQNNLPKGSLIVAKDGSGNYKTVFIHKNYIYIKYILDKSNKK